MRLPFLQATVERPLRQPAPTLLPTLPAVGLAALYRGARLGGDFYDFAITQCGRLVFLLLDVAGKRNQALEIAASVQERFLEKTPELFHGQDVNQSDALNDLGVIINREILKAAGGVRHAPAFVGCYDPRLGTLTYVNAGHTPAVMKDAEGITMLKANGLPLGLFSHSTYDAGVAVLQPGGAVLLVSKGLVESRNGSKEFGLDRVLQVMEAREFRDAQELCAAVLGAVETFTRQAAPENDTTALAQLFTSGSQTPLNALEGSFTSFSPQQAVVAYAESLAAVEYIRDTYGMSDVVRLLERIGQGSSTEAALRATIHSGYASLEEELAQYLKKTYGT